MYSVMRDTTILDKNSAELHLSSKDETMECCLARDFKNSIAGGRLGPNGIDIQIVDYFKRMKAKDPSFFYAVQVDQFLTIRNVFWVDSRSRHAYKCFGDVVMLDMTYKNNHLNMHLVPFTGVNHHRQTVPFGSALLNRKGESTFIWLFETWLEAMSNKHPVSIITNQDEAMKAAIAKVLPKTRHAFCKWHIMMKLPQKLGLLVRRVPDFVPELKDCMNNSLTIDEFESNWRLLLDRHDLKDNEWLKSIYDVREHWVPSFLKDTFFASMCTAQRSKSMTNFFNRYVKSRTSLKEFVMQYEKTLEGKYEKELRADFDEVNTMPILKTPIPMEEEAAAFYTRQNLAVFQDEIRASLVCVVCKDGEDGLIETYRVAKIDGQELYIVMFNCSKTEVTCGCKKFEFEGILCRHIVAVLRARNIFTFPRRYIKKRWTKEANKGVDLDLYGVETQDNVKDSPITQRNINKGSQVDSSVNQIRDTQHVNGKGMSSEETRYEKPLKEPLKRQRDSTFNAVGHEKSTCKMLRGLEQCANVGQSDQEISSTAFECCFDANAAMLDREISSPNGQCSCRGNASIGMQ